MTNGAAVCSGMATIGGGTNGYTGGCTERTVRLANMATAATSSTAEAGSISCWSSEREGDIKSEGEISRAKEREAGKNSNVFPARCAFLFLSRSYGEGKRPPCCAPSCIAFSPIVAPLVPARLVVVTCAPPHCRVACILPYQQTLRSSCCCPAGTLRSPRRPPRCSTSVPTTMDLERPVVEVEASNNQPRLTYIATDTQPCSKCA